MSRKSNSERIQGQRKKVQGALRKNVKGVLEHWKTPEVEDLHYGWTFIGVFSHNNPHREVIERRYATDKNALLWHAQQALLVGLERGVSVMLLISLLDQRSDAAALLDWCSSAAEYFRWYAARTQTMVWRRFVAYYRSLELHYRQWVEESPEGNFADFLASAPGEEHEAKY